MEEKLFEFTIGRKSYREKSKSVQIAYQRLMENKAFSLSDVGNIVKIGEGEYEMTIPTIKIKKI